MEVVILFKQELTRWVNAGIAAPALLEDAQERECIKGKAEIKRLRKAILVGLKALERKEVIK